MRAVYRKLRPLAEPCARCLARVDEPYRSLQPGCNREPLLSVHDIRVQLRRETERQASIRLARGARR